MYVILMCIHKPSHQKFNSVTVKSQWIVATFGINYNTMNYSTEFSLSETPKCVFLCSVGRQVQDLELFQLYKKVSLL